MSNRARPDHFTLKARKMGYPARSVFKLEEMQKKWSLIKKGKPVLDVGAAPGSWTLYALRTMGKAGQVTAVDLKPLTIKSPPGANLRFRQGDVFTAESAEFLAEGGPYGCVLSDAAPATSGFGYGGLAYGHIKAEPSSGEGGAKRPGTLSDATPDSVP